jgi:hypothetical protein
MFVRRLLAICLLILLPLQFSWAAVASYCGHEAQIDATHFGHHEHKHHAKSIERTSWDANQHVDSVTSVGAGDGTSPGALDLDCGHCHGTYAMILALLPALSGALPTVPPSAALDRADGAQAPSRPERPQWLPLA